ncbi:hypothetical protein B0T18DRAFT_455615 [Schizothecium vesticola]|uniref:Uncharacterized protein n=1 Tax=Schizothecium vesticola TaxID=314040 RepID=A0AA40KDU3_9PEZI|nr:hypothetical protein B0T18DRAFT_455615 [Schizothecium vesticola]
MLLARDGLSPRQESIVGKVPELCLRGSEFATNYQTCQSCLDANLEGDALEKTRKQMNAVFQEFLVFCDAAPPQATSSGVQLTSWVPIPTSWLTRSTWTRTTTITAIGLGDRSTSAVYTILGDALVTRSDWTGFLQQTTVSSTAPGTSMTPPPSGATSSNSNGWDSPRVAGVAVGAIAGLFFLAGLAAYVLYYHRRKRRQKKPEQEDKPQLHSDSLPVPDSGTNNSVIPELPANAPELDAPSQLPSLYDSRDRRVPERLHGVEMGANEPAAQEM